MRRRIAICAVCLGTLLTLPISAPAQAVEFFEKKIRPALAEHCFKCHSSEAEKSKKLKGGLRLDTRDGPRKGGDSGPAIVPGKADHSLLIKVLRYDGDVKMPPTKKLPEAVIADFERWVAMGAPDPRTDSAATAKSTGMSVEEGRKFWAFRPPNRSPLPAVRDVTWPVNGIDQFVLARLEAAGLEPAPDADRATLARRVFYDLVGLPPTPEEVDALTADKDPLAYEKLVDRLLASPQFGERWGRHWLDVARFAESVTLRGFILKEAWRYRDYVIEAFNHDMPFDQFVREQIAGDLLPAKSLDDRRRQLVATTFLQLGNTNLEEQDKKQLRMDVVDEQLDVITKGFLAQTVTCARCHDHKFDPIPTRDYYALAGILRNAKAMEHANVSKWIEVPLPAEPAEEARIRAHEQAVVALEKQIKTEKAKATGKSARGALAIKDVPGIVVDDTQAKKVGEWKESQYSGNYIGRGYVHDLNAGKGEKTLTFQPELPASGKYDVWLAYTPGTNRDGAVPVTVFSADGEKTISVDMRQPPSIDGRFLSLGQYHFERNGAGFVLIANEGTTGHVVADAVAFLPADRAPERGDKPSVAPDVVRRLEAELKKLQQDAPRREMVMSVVEEPTIEDTRVHIRGSVHTLGEPAPRGFLQVAVVATPPPMPANESGRRQLAEWIAGRDNPLTARVIVNRAWHWLFGAGLVRTPDNFGTTGETPSHPELLDALAIQFMDDGWSIKNLVREIVLSRTYRQHSSIRNPQTAVADPENRLLARQNRRRLDAECVRDTMLFVSGRLRLDAGGPTYPAKMTADYGYRHDDTRRSVYSPVFRNALPELFEAFDFADPSMVTGRRNVSTVAPQALLMMNHPFAIEQARAAAGRLVGHAVRDGSKSQAQPDLLEWAYRLTLGRPPTDGERRVGLKFLGERSEDACAAWTLLFQSLFASADFRYLN
jgi:hypothetical protein